MSLNKPFTQGLKPKLSYEELMNAVLEGPHIKAKKGANLYDNRYISDTFEMSKFRQMNFLDLEN
jgi:hypothetical protein